MEAELQHVHPHGGEPHVVEPTDTPTQQGQLEVFVADAPPEFDQLNSVNMTITRVEAIGIVGSGATTGTKVLWIALIAILPVLGLILWYFMGPKANYGR